MWIMDFCWWYPLPPSFLISIFLSLSILFRLPLSLRLLPCSWIKSAAASASKLALPPPLSSQPIERVTKSALAEFCISCVPRQRLLPFVYVLSFLDTAFMCVALWKGENAWPPLTTSVQGGKTAHHPIHWLSVQGRGVHHLTHCLPVQWKGTHHLTHWLSMEGWGSHYLTHWLLLHGARGLTNWSTVPVQGRDAHYPSYWPPVQGRGVYHPTHWLSVQGRGAHHFCNAGHSSAME